MRDRRASLAHIERVTQRAGVGGTYLMKKSVQNRSRSLRVDRVEFGSIARGDNGYFPDLRTETSQNRWYLVGGYGEPLANRNRCGVMIHAK